MTSLIWNKPGRPASVKIDGMRDIKVIRAVSRDHAGGWVGITVELLAREGGEKNEVVLTVPDETQAALVALGWTPPEPPMGYMVVEGAPGSACLCAHGPDELETRDEAVARQKWLTEDRTSRGPFVACALVPVTEQAAAEPDDTNN